MIPSDQGLNIFGSTWFPSSARDENEKKFFHTTTFTPRKSTAGNQKDKKTPRELKSGKSSDFQPNLRKIVFRFQNVHFQQIHGPPTPACKAEHNTPRNQPIHRFGEASFLKTHPALGCFWGAWSVYGFPVVLGACVCFLCCTFAVVLVRVFTQASNTHQVFKNKTLFIAGLGKWKKKREALNHVERDESPQDWLTMVH